MLPNFAEFRSIFSCLGLEIVSYTPVGKINVPPEKFNAKRPFPNNWQQNKKTLEFCFNQIEKGIATGFGLVTGNGLLAIDFDRENSFKIAAAINSWLIETETLSWTSGKPHSLQKLFKIPDNRLEDFANFTNKKINSYGDIKQVKGEQLELRYKGSQSVLPPSKHPETDYYQWIYSDSVYSLNDSQCDCLLSIIYPSTISEKPKSIDQKTKSTVTIESQKTTLNNYEKYLSDLTLPINEEIPLEICLAPNTREWLNGVSQGMRDSSGFTITCDLIGTTNYLDNLGQSYKMSGSIPELLLNYCQKCSPPLTIEDYERIYQSAQNHKPKPSLDIEKIDNCIKAWYWNNNQEIKSLYQSKKESKTNNTLSDKTTDTVEKQSKVEKLDNIAETRNILVNDYSQRLRFNELKRIVELDNEEAYLDDLYLKIHEDYGIKVSKQIAYDLAVMIAKKNSYHPVKDYLDSLETDNQEIDIKNLSSLFFDTTDKIYDEMVYRHLIGSVARIYKSGCKFDTALILQGSQGIRKSTFFKVLYGDDFFTDSVSGTDRDNLLIAHQNWCCELAEFETITNKKASGELKAFLSKSVDTFREPYARSNRMVKRQCVIVGSVNECEFLVDTTGNRRFWIIPVNTQINTDTVIKYRDAIWYQAKKAFLKGEFWYLEEKYQKESEALNKEYLYQSTWDCIELDNCLENVEKSGVSSKEILMNVFKFDLKDIKNIDEKRIGQIMRKKGWVNKPFKRNGKTQRLWIKEIFTKSENSADPADPILKPLPHNGYDTDQQKDRQDQQNSIPLEKLVNFAKNDLNQDKSEKHQSNLNSQESSNEKTEINQKELKIWRLGLHKELLENNITDKESMLTYIREGLNIQTINSFNDLSID